ncbi:hypothetical protein BU24DRAFT_25163 [Aaosphaeria arxii CBS 175.79]|uniref:Uncharacterized protein n=1 Tax=Aaosphaeria arxii CBS 175.79 TaxID=1450172 RepID=A0A6A5Y8L1_9PLEO|nr:uncharacterized protein BU24DRAFT_25163 [Aaosphaeria arxii CBS 175.79]KAF2021669.1 hypothetical protein BU24DRAFT_25163 [Aaosphaeria arxii CBS 175.79]
MDSIVGDTSSWPLHLQGAAEILRNFAYHDALMSVTMDRGPLILGYYWQDDNGNEVTHVADSYFGFASTPIFHIAQTSALLSNVRSGVRTTTHWRFWPICIGVQLFCTSIDPSTAIAQISKRCIMIAFNERWMQSWTTRALCLREVRRNALPSSLFLCVAPKLTGSITHRRCEMASSQFRDRGISKNFNHAISVLGRSMEVPLCGGPRTHPLQNR